MNHMETNAAVFKMKLIRSMIFLGVLQFTAAVFAAGDADDFYEMKKGGEQMIAVLEALPYVQEGSGPVMFTFEYSECPYCQGMYRDYKVKDTGLTARRIFVPVSDRTAKETAAMGKSRSVQDYHDFMKGRKQAPAFNQDSDAIGAYNAVIDGLEKVEEILRNNGWPRRGIVFPQFIWIENDRVFTSAGYEMSDFGKAVARAKKGGGTADVWSRMADAADTASVRDGSNRVPARESNGVNIIGLELGMTKDDAYAALKAYNPDLEIYEQPVKIVMQDSNRQQFVIGSYLKGIRAWWGQGRNGFNVLEDASEKIVLYFSPPPSENRLEYIGREVTYPTAKGPDYELAMDSIREKYGDPTFSRPEDVNAVERGVAIQFWQYSGAALNEQQFGQWINESKFMTPLSLQTGGFHPLAPKQAKIVRKEQGGSLLYYEGGVKPIVNAGQNLGILVNKQGNLVFMIRSALWEDRAITEERRAQTWDMGNAALQQHEQKLRGAAQQRQGPKL